MLMDRSRTRDAEAASGLPPVTPPSGRHILQLFLIPGIVVAVFVLGYLGWKRLTHGWYTPEAFLKRLDNADPDVRWRAADDLAQVLLRDDQLASDPQFGLSLCERLRQAIDAGAGDEKASAERSSNRSTGEQASDHKALEAGRDYVEYLSACAGNLSVPVGLAVLCRMATSNSDADASAILRRRRRAVWALANLAENLKRFDRLSAERKAEVLDSLARETGPTQRGDWARDALGCLRGREAGSPQAVGVDEALARTAADDDPFLREMTAVALSTWQGDREENTRMERTLVRLSGDDGHSADGEANRWRNEIRAQAAVALARRGSDRVSAQTLASLLDEQAQLARFRRKRPDGQDGPDEAVVFATLSSTARAVAELHRRNPSRDLSSLRPALERLTASPNPALRIEAKQALAVLADR